MADRALAAGVDLGGTKIHSLIADEAGTVLGEDRRMTEVDLGTDAVIGRIVDSVHASLEAASIQVSDLKGLGISTPGPCDPVKGIVTEAPNLHWFNVPLVQLVKDKIGIPTLLENDAAAAAYGEMRYGAAKGLKHVLYVTLGTGIGGGIIIDGKIYAGASGAAGEVGHLVLEPDGVVCNCGARGCLEALASGPAIAREATAVVDSGRETSMAGVDNLTAEDVLAAAKQGDEAAREVLARGARYLGLGLIGMLNTLNPEALILGGGLLALGEYYIEPAFQTARECGFDQVLDDVVMTTAGLGGRSGALGAAALAFDRL
jgi:glucokinase